MSEPDSFPQINDDELILRRIPIRPGWYDPETGIIDRQAFQPTKNDHTGLSVTRARSDSHPEFLTSGEDAALGGNPSGYYVAVLRVGDLRNCGIQVVPRPIIPENPGHAELSQLTHELRKSDAVIDATSQLADNLTLRVEGPFAT